MKKLRNRQSQRAIKQQLPKSGKKQIGAAHYFGDAHGSVVHDDGELVGGKIVFSPNHEVAKIHSAGGALPASLLIKELESFVLRHAKAPVITVRPLFVRYC